jgi:hypothetical protein
MSRPIKAGPTPESLKELQVAVLAVKVMDKDLKRSIDQATREQVTGMWQGELAGNSSTIMDDRVLVKGARVAAGNPPRLIASASRRPIGAGLVPDRHGRSFEFGTKDREKQTTYTRTNRRNAGSHQVTRRTRRQLPDFTKSGRVVFPAVASTMPRAISLWTQLIMRKVYDAFGDK